MTPTASARWRTPVRQWAMSAALLPALAVQATAFGQRALLLAALAMLAAVGGDALGRAARRQSVREALSQGYPLFAGLVFALCAPGLANAPVGPGLRALALLAIAAAARDARHPAFPPAMAALAALPLVPLMPVPASLAPATAWSFEALSPDRALALAYLAAGLALLTLRIVRAAAVLAALTGSSLALLMSPVLNLPAGIAPSTTCLLAFVLVAEPGLACAGRRARAFAGMLFGALAVALPGAHGPLGALPYAALLVAACTPWLDGLPDPHRAGTEPAA